jgi:hypothetical protein
MPWFMWSPWLMQSVYKVNMTNPIFNNHNFVNAPTRMWRPSVWFCSWLLGCVGRFLFFPFFPIFFLLSFLLYFVWQGWKMCLTVEGVYVESCRKSWTSLIPFHLSLLSVHQANYIQVLSVMEIGLKHRTVLYLTSSYSYVTFIYLFCLSSAHYI